MIRELSNRAMTTLLHGKREKKNVTREITFIKLRLLFVTSHVARVVNRNRANKTALRKIISITVSLPRFIIIRLLYYIRGQSLIIDRSNLLLFNSDEFELYNENVLLSFESRRVFHREIVQLSDVLIRPRFSPRVCSTNL